MIFQEDAARVNMYNIWYDMAYQLVYGIWHHEQPYDPREPGQYAYQVQVDNSPPPSKLNPIYGYTTLPRSHW